MAEGGYPMVCTSVSFDLMASRGSRAVMDNLLTCPAPSASLPDGLTARVDVVFSRAIPISFSLVRSLARNPPSQ
jgi:hypothetical protein